MQSFKIKLQDLKNYLHLTDTRVKGLGVGFGVILVGYAGYSLFSKQSTSNETSNITQQQPTFGEVFTEAIKAVSQALAKNNRDLSSQVIKQIIRSQYKLAEQKYVELFLKLRKDRRKAINDKQQYSRLILSIDRQIEQLMEGQLNAILAHFSIDKAYWIEAVQIWTSQSEQNRQQWEALLFDVEHDQLASLRKTHKQPLKLKKLLQIIDFKINTLKTFDPNTFQMDNSSEEEQPDLNAKYTLIDTYISDLVFKKFGVQEQDINYSVEALEQKDKQTFENHEDEFTELMRTQIFGEQDEDDQGNWEDEQDGSNPEGEQHHSSQGEQSRPVHVEQDRSVPLLQDHQARKIEDRAREQQA